jgi:hypothetical protein
MTKLAPLFSKEELSLFGYELYSKFRSGVRAVPSFLYLACTLLGVGWASYAIPAINKSEISAETLGIYVIGVVISVTLDALLILIAQKGDIDGNSNGRAIAALFWVLGIVLTVWASFLSISPGDALAPTVGIPAASLTHIEAHKKWHWGAEFFLCFILFVSIAMSLILAGFDSDQPTIGSLERDPNAIKDRN